MHQHEAKPAKKGEKPVYPDTYKLTDGATIIGIAVNFRPQAGEYVQDVYECLIRGHGEKLYTIWWPFKLPAVPLKTPFALKRISKSAYNLSVTETLEEGRALWIDGKVGDEATVNQSHSPMAVAARDLMSKFGQ